MSDRWHVNVCCLSKSVCWEVILQNGGINSDDSFQYSDYIESVESDSSVLSTNDEVEMKPKKKGKETKNLEAK